MARTGDTHNLGHMLSLRNHSHAQKEIREYAIKVDEAHKKHTPVANEALHNYTMEGMNISREDIKIMQEIGAFNSEFDSNNLENFKGHGWLGKDEGGNFVWGKSREGPAFQAKIKKLRGE
jgi:thymidylate synthase ThyX